MSENTFIFIPNTLDYSSEGFVEGFHQEFPDCHAFYVTNTKVSKQKSQLRNCIGKLSKEIKYPKEEHAINIDSLSHDVKVQTSLKQNSVLKIIYDYKAFKNTNVLTTNVDRYGIHFKLLSEYLRNGDTVHVGNGHISIASVTLGFIVYILGLILQGFNKCKPLLGYSATFSHFEDNLLTWQWFFKDLNEEKKITPRTGNILVAKILDLFIGVVLLNYLIENEEIISDFIRSCLEFIIVNLKLLLTYLMGSPIGLKLNFAFNRTLGTFFFYHISLWSIFLFGMEPLVMAYFRFMILPLTFGLSFQIAMLSDIMSIATFHAYCIYVYAARLFSLQLKALTSLWRLFIGRKYNPLRGRVDSCQYSQHQLFIGTLSFTVLLFLLPTSALYYSVFATLRVSMLIIDVVLCKLRYILKSLPIYITILWLIKSQVLAGAPHLNWKVLPDNSGVELEANLNILPYFTSLASFLPTCNEIHHQTEEKNNLSSIFHKLFTGILL